MVGVTGFEPADLSHPKRALYQAELHPDALALYLLILPDWCGDVKSCMD